MISFLEYIKIVAPLTEIGSDNEDDLFDEYCSLSYEELEEIEKSAPWNRKGE